MSSNQSLSNLQYNKLRYLLIPTEEFYYTYLYNKNLPKFIVKSPNERLNYIEQLEEIIDDKNQQFCDKLNFQFISNHIKSSDFIIIIINNSDDQVILNFMTGEIKNNKLFIHITCTHKIYRSRGLLTRVNKAITAIGNFINIPKIVVNSIEEKVPTYKHLGYVTNSSNNNLNHPLMQKLQKGGRTMRRKTRKLFAKTTCKSLKIRFSH
jgi:hypothetical protein